MRNLKINAMTLNSLSLKAGRWKWADEPAIYSASRAFLYIHLSVRLLIFVL
jgi:hypothetical protein